MELNITDKNNWGFLKKKIKELKIFNPENYTESFLSRRIECRLRATSLNSYGEYARLLERSDKEKEALNKDLTINVTSFFRDIKTYEAIKNGVIPMLMQTREEDSAHLKTINIWSAGSASGEEAYSIAILFKEALSKKLSQYPVNVNIQGTDIDCDAIEQAKKGIYGEQQLKEIPPEYKKKYFDQEGQNYLLKDEIKKMVRFQAGDILSAGKPKNLDLILCRNTVIYFNAEAKAKLYNDFYSILNKNGFLILGKTEILMGSARELFQIFNSNERIYCKE